MDWTYLSDLSKVTIGISFSMVPVLDKSAPLEVGKLAAWAELDDTVWTMIEAGTRSLMFWMKLRLLEHVMWLSTDHPLHIENMVSEITKTINKVEHIFTSLYGPIF